MNDFLEDNTNNDYTEDYDDYLFFFADTIMKLWDDKEVHKKVLKWKEDVNNAIRGCSITNNIDKKNYFMLGEIKIKA